MEDCNCKEQCLSKISITIRKLIHEDFQNLSTNCEKYLYFSGLIYKAEKKKIRRRKSKTNFLFHVRVDGYHIRICQKAFEIIHGIKRLDICKLLKKLSGNGIRLDPDEEFAKLKKLKPKARSTNSKKFVEEHVKSIFTKSEVNY